MPEVRDEAWPFLLHYYPFHSRTSERKNIKAEKTKQYLDLNERRYCILHTKIGALRRRCIYCLKQEEYAGGSIVIL